jgi:phage shock protein A
MADDSTPGTPDKVPPTQELPPTPVTPPDTGYTADGVPTLDGVREKIETRYGTALGATELAQDTPEGRTSAQRYEARQHAAAEKLEQIRESMHQQDSDGSG